MKIKLLVARSGVDFANNAGDEIDVDSDEAARMIESGQAVSVLENASSKAKFEKAAK